MERFKHPFSKEEIQKCISVNDIMPAYNELDNSFKHGNTKWNEATNTWFFKCIKKSQFTPKEGIDIDCAFMHLGAIMSSYEPKHEHKEAGVAFLMSLWFDDVKL